VSADTRATHEHPGLRQYRCREAWPSGVPCWSRPAASTSRTTTSLRPTPTARSTGCARRAMPWRRDRPCSANCPEAPHELAALLDVHLMLLQDESLTGATKTWIRERHYNAEWALSAQLEVLARQFDEMEDAYLRERKADVEQVVERLLRALARSEPGGAGCDARCSRLCRRGPAGAGGQRRRASGHDAVQAQRVHGLRHRRRWPHIAHRHRGAQPGHSGGGRRARSQPPDPPGRLGRDRRRCRCRHRQPVAHRAGGIPIPAAPERAGARPTDRLRTRRR
jgi:hypothetical protein